MLSMTLFKAPRGGAVEQSETEGVVEILRFAQYDRPIRRPIGELSRSD